jgi:hypothetical protein
MRSRFKVCASRSIKFNSAVPKFNALLRKETNYKRRFESSRLTTPKVKQSFS